MTKRSQRGTLRRLDSLATDGVERAEPGGPPVAFRIWKAGDNVTDHGPTLFTERSAALLMVEQATRGNRYSIDVDHLSLDKAAPIQNHAAVGWHSLEVRGGELWAVAVEWSDTVRAGLSKDPPEWKYFSPAYDIDEATGEVVSYLNTALTNNPATHRVTALAARGATRKQPMAKAAKKMSWGDIKAALDGDDENAKASAYAAIKAAFPDDAPESKKDAEEEPPESKKDAEEEPPESKKDAEEPPEKKDAKDGPDEKCAEDEPEKKDAKASVAASLLAAQDARIRKLEADARKRAEGDERTERSRLLASRVMSKELAASLADKPLAFVKDVCAALPVKTVNGSTEHVQATRGAGQDTDGVGRLPADERSKMQERMGIKPVRASIKHEGVHQIFPAMTPDEARAHLAALAKKEGN